jgi:hypothetical protein
VRHLSVLCDWTDTQGDGTLSETRDGRRSSGAQAQPARAAVLPLASCGRGGRPCESGARTSLIVPSRVREQREADFHEAPENKRSLVPSAFVGSATLRYLPAGPEMSPAYTGTCQRDGTYLAARRSPMSQRLLWMRNPGRESAERGATAAFAEQQVTFARGIRESARDATPRRHRGGF